MAKQNFTAGGFYGKLGALVGQRWKNKRIVRSYVVPANPRTALQQANRNNFKIASESANIALAFNKGSPIWNIEGKTEYMARVSVAKKRVDGGVEGWLVVPLYPDGTTPEAVLLDITGTYDTQGQLILSSATYAELNIERIFTLRIEVFNNTAGRAEFMFIEATAPAGEAEIAKVTLPQGYSLVQGAKCVGITKDDSDHNGKFYYIPPQNIQGQQTIVIDDIIARYGNNTEIQLLSEKSQIVRSGYSITAQYQVYDTVQGLVKTKTAELQTVAGQSYFLALPVEWYEAAYSDCAVSFSVTGSPSGAPTLEVSGITLALGQKTVTAIENISSLGLNEGNRATGLFTVQLPAVPAGAVAALSARADYIDFRGREHEQELIKTLSNEPWAEADTSVGVAFSVAPTVFETNDINISGDITTREIHIVIAKRIEISDSTQKLIELQSFYNDSNSSWIDLETRLTGDNYLKLLPLPLICEAVAQDIGTGETVYSSTTQVSLYASSATTPYNSLVVALQTTYPKTNGMMCVNQSDFATAASPYYIKRQLLSLGKATYAGEEAIYDAVFSPAGLISQTAVSSHLMIRFGEVKSTLPTIFTAYDPSSWYIEDEDGNSLDAQTAYFEENNDKTLTLHIMLDGSPSGDAANIEWEIIIDIANDMLDGVLLQVSSGEL